MRIIDADAFKEGWNDSVLGNTMRMVIDGQPTIDPESLPVVQQLRAELEHEKKCTQSAIKCMRSHGWCGGCKHFAGTRGCDIEKYEDCVPGHDFYELRED